MILVPAVYIVFSAVAGLAVNMALPLLQWENEIQVVKQSGATAVSLFIAFAVWMVPTGILTAFPQWPAEAVQSVTLILVAGLTVVLYTKACRREIDYEAH